MALVGNHPWGKHVAFGSAGVGLVPFLHNHDSIMCVTVYEVYMEFGYTPHPPCRPRLGIPLKPPSTETRPGTFTVRPTAGCLPTEFPVQFHTGSGRDMTGTHPPGPQKILGI